MKVNTNALPKLEDFKKEAKFKMESSGEFYQGLSNPTLQPKLSQLLNISADEFIMVVKHHPTERKFQDEIKIGLERFNPYYLDLDTEDREKVCLYFQCMMDCVGLTSSDGELNKWLYGFDPNKKY